MYHLCRERHAYTKWITNKDKELEPTEVWIDADVLCRDDGVRLIRIGKLPGHADANGDIVLDLSAIRTHWRGTVTGTYKISLELDARRDAIRALEATKVKEIAADIDAALRAWPTPSGQESIPIGVIVFSIRTLVGVSSGGLKNHTLTFGHPLKLRDVPPSTRWQPRTVTHRAPSICFFIGHDPGGRTKECEALVKDDGTRLIRFRSARGPENDGPDEFNFSDQDISFDFDAERRLSTFVMSDTWEVRLDPPQGEMPSKGLSPGLRAQLGPARFAEIVRNIEEALYAWPQETGHAYETPINRVVFLDADM